MNDYENLSAQGERRREQILAQVQREARRIRIRRYGRRMAGACAAVVVILGGAWRWTHAPATRELPQIVHRATQPEQAPLPKPEKAPIPIPRAVQRPREIVITQVVTDTTLLSKWAVPPQAATWQRLDDDGFLAQLAAAGKPAGLATVGGRTTVLYRETR